MYTAKPIGKAKITAMNTAYGAASSIPIGCRPNSRVVTGVRRWPPAPRRGRGRGRVSGDRRPGGGGGHDWLASWSILVAASVMACCTSDLPKMTAEVQASRKVCQISTEFGMFGTSTVRAAWSANSL